MHTRGLTGLIALVIVAAAALLTVPTGGARDDSPPLAPTPTTIPSARPSTHEANVLLVWGHGGTDQAFSSAVQGLAGVVAVSSVRVDRRDLAQAVTSTGTATTELPRNWVFPLDTAAIDPVDHAAVLGEAADVLAGLDPGEALLGAASARLRGLDVGSVLTMSTGSQRTVVGIVDDRVGGFAELIVHPDDDLAIDVERYLLVRHDGDVAAVSAAIRAAADEPLRVLPMADASFPRHGNGVLPQVVIKTHFGEFAMTEAPGRRIQVGQSWRDDHLVARTLPRVGFTVCHRVVADAFEAVLADLDDQGLLQVLDPGKYQGCWLGRVIGSSRTLSHHSWGLAVDVNVNPADVFTADLPRTVIETFQRHGFVWGGDFLRPDEPHFEYVGDLMGR